jgi:hypothetical protein
VTPSMIRRPIVMRSENRCPFAFAAAQNAAKSSGCISDLRNPLRAPIACIAWAASSMSQRPRDLQEVSKVQVSHGGVDPHDRPEPAEGVRIYRVARRAEVTERGHQEPTRAVPADHTENGTFGDVGISNLNSAGRSARFGAGLLAISSLPPWKHW